MGWRDRLHNGGIATWRGIAFEVESASSKFGRRNVVHEYPKRDKPFVEDLGRAARQFTLRGFIIGDDYAASRTALIAACEEEGSGILVHPYLGPMTVSLQTPADIGENFKDGRSAKLSFAFIESGEIEFPGIELDTSQGALQAADDLNVAASAEFEDEFVVAAQPGFVVDAAEDDLSDLTTRLRGSVDPFFSVVDDFAAFSELVDDYAADVSTLAATPDVAASRLVAIFVEVGSLDALRALHESAGTAGPLDASTSAALAEQRNTEATLRLQVRGALAAAVKIVALTAFVALDDAEAVSVDLADRLAEETKLANTNDAFVALVELRTKLVEHVDVTIQGLPRLRTVKVPVLTPAVVLAWDLYGDATRDDEIAERNKVSNPLLLSPSLDIQVLTS